MVGATQEQIHQDRVVHQNPYRHVTGDGEFRASSPKGHPAVDLPVQLSDAELRGGKTIDAEFSEEEIEEIVRGLQNKLWNQRSEIWGDDAPANPLDVLDPSIALEAVGYVCIEVDSLGQVSEGDGESKIAATIESQRRRVEVSGDFPVEVLRFTAAHELGHALLHKAEGLHRDRPINKVQPNSSRERREVEADKFATFFLMPAKRVKKEFSGRFGTQHLHLTQDTAYGLKPGAAAELLSESDNLRDFARAVAGSDRFHHDHFTSLAECFGVSIEAMAIRLEELDLVGC
jgi:hypothetical protein